MSLDISRRCSDDLEAFFKYWDQRVRDGKNSPMGTVEVMMLEIYDNWLRVRREGKEE